MYRGLLKQWHLVGPPLPGRAVCSPGQQRLAGDRPQCPCAASGPTESLDRHQPAAGCSIQWVVPRLMRDRWTESGVLTPGAGGADCGVCITLLAAGAELAGPQHCRDSKGSAMLLGMLLLPPRFRGVADAAAAACSLEACILITPAMLKAAAAALLPPGRCWSPGAAASRVRARPGDWLAIEAAAAPDGARPAALRTAAPPGCSR